MITRAQGRRNRQGNELDPSLGMQLWPTRLEYGSRGHVDSHRGSARLWVAAWLRMTEREDADIVTSAPPPLTSSDNSTKDPVTPLCDSTVLCTTVKLCPVLMNLLPLLLAQTLLQVVLIDADEPRTREKHSVRFCALTPSHSFDGVQHLLTQEPRYKSGSYPQCERPDASSRRLFAPPAMLRPA